LHLNEGQTDIYQIFIKRGKQITNIDQENEEAYFISISITLYLIFNLSIPLQTRAQSSLHSFPLQQVTLLPGIFKDAQETDMAYMLALDPDRLLAPYLTEVGLTPKKESYGNWENTGLNGHIGGHYLAYTYLEFTNRIWRLFFLFC